ncbi:MAG: hypothetical protein QF619_05375 [Candidatus Binatia bacterium]|nr:hypothetical protein [Candidatus Binatia bacterium]
MPEGVGPIGVASMVGGWKEESYEEALGAWNPQQETWAGGFAIPSSTAARPWY